MIGNGLTLNDGPLGELLDNLCVSGGEARIPSGDYVLSQKFARSFPKGGRLIGDEATLIWNSGEGFDFSFTDQYKPIKLEGITFKTRSQGGVALKITGPTLSAGTSCVEVYDLAFMGDDPANDCWAEGLVLDKCWNPLIDRILVKGQDDATSPFVMQNAIRLENCMAPSLRGLRIYHCENGIKCNVTEAIGGEGFDAQSFEIVGVTNGFNFPATTGLRPGTVIANGHVNAYSRCLILNNRAQMNLSGLLLYKTHVSTSYWQAIELVNSNGCVAVGNNFRGSPTATGGNDAITLVATHCCHIGTNIIDDFASTGAGVLLAAGSDFNRIEKQIRGTNVTTAVLSGAGTNNTVLDV